jgi:hypothetical protein
VGKSTSDACSGTDSIVTSDTNVKRVMDKNAVADVSIIDGGFVHNSPIEQDPFLCTMDFGKNYITEAMKWGQSDARDIALPRFVRQPRPSGL